MGRTTKICEAVLIAAFIGAIWLPLIDNLLGLDSTAASMEKRVLNPLLQRSLHDVVDRLARPDRPAEPAEKFGNRFVHPYVLFDDQGS